MRAVGLSDLDIAVRALLAAPRADWADMSEQLIEQAHAADLWRQRHGSAHPNGATGSLYAQAALLPRVSNTCCSSHYCAALTVVPHALATWRDRGSSGADPQT